MHVPAVCVVADWCGQARLMPVALFYLFLYTIGYPAVVAYIVFRYRLRIMEDQVLVTKDTGDTRASNPHCYDFRKKYQKLYYQFRPDCYFWVLVVLGRKFGIAFTGLMFRKNPGFQVSCCAGSLSGNRT